MKILKQVLLYEGKAKKVFLTSSDDYVIIEYKDDATAFNGVKKSIINNKGILNNEITAHIFTYLEQAGIKTHFRKKLNDREQLCEKLIIFKLEVIVRNIVAGSMAKRLGMTEGTVLSQPVLELCYKNDEYMDPLINDDHVVALGLATTEQLEEIKSKTKQINGLLKTFFLKRGIKCVDFKLEFGLNKEGEVVLADEISPDTCRLWDLTTNEKLDKDRFRRDLGDVEDAYNEILKRIKRDELSCQN